MTVEPASADPTRPDGQPPAMPSASPRRYPWPASRRARAAARRHARGAPASSIPRDGARALAETAAAPLGRATPERSGSSGHAAALESRLAADRTRLRGERRLFTLARVRRQRSWALGALAATAVVGLALALLGLSTVRNSTAGRYVEPPAGPDEPGYQAYVVSTPTLGLVQRAGDDGLAATTVLALRPDDEGGSLLLVPTTTAVPADDEGEGEGESDGDAASETTVAEAYDRGGAQAAVQAVTDLLDVAVDDYAEVDDSGWASLVAPVAPITLSLSQPVAVWPAGEVALQAADVGPFLASRGDGETELDRMARHAAFWDAWLAAVRAGGPEAVPGEADGGIGRFVRAIAEAPRAEILPVEPVGSGSSVVYRRDEVRTAALVARAVPYPLSPAPGRRVRVRVLNGTTDADLTSSVARPLVQAGAEITIAGNASSFDVRETTFTYRSAELRRSAERLAEALGVGRVEGEGAQSSPDPATSAGPDGGESGEEIDVTIVLGSDAQDLIGRLESAG